MNKFLNTPLKREILRQLYYQNIVTCGDLSALLDKSIPLIGKAVAELLESGMITTADYAGSTGGRKALQYTIRPNSVFVLAVAMDQLYTTVSVLDISDNNAVYFKRFSLKLLNNDAALEQLVECIHEILIGSKIPPNKILGIGLGMPGFVNTKTGYNQSYAFTDNQISVREYLKDIFKIPVIMDNDSSIIALGESKFGMAKGKKDVLVVNISWGIGLGMLIDGKIFRGNTGYAGELSHIPTAENDILCECGKKGCLETEATLRTVAQHAIDGMRKGVFSGIQSNKDDSTEEIAYAVMYAANRGDQFCIELISDMAYKIGKALAILIHIINPEQILLSGRASEVGKLLIAPIQQALNKYCIPRLMESVELNVSTLKYKAYSIGAAALVIDNLSDVNNVAA